jgi:glycogen debranching enzyme
MPYAKTAVRFACGADLLHSAFKIAVADLNANIKPFKGGLLERKKPVFISGAWYSHPWTRDNAYNTWNGGGLLYPEIARDTLLAVIRKQDGKLRIDGQYWDCIAWATGAWAFYRYTADRGFLAIALEAIRNTLAHFEATERDRSTGLFMGQPGCSDGVSAFPENYRIAGHSDGNLESATVIADGETKVTMKSLSTNCLYVNAYRVAAEMTEVLGLPAGQAKDFRAKAEAVKHAINRHLWLKNKGRYAYFLDRNGLDVTQESLGAAFAILFGVADRAQADALFQNQHVTRYGVPCLWPQYPEYHSADNMTYGRHTGTIWPMQMGFWAQAAAMQRRLDVFSAEMFSLATLAVRSGQFSEIYHPLTGEPYGGLQVIEEEQLFNPHTGEPYGEFQTINGRRFYLTASKPQTTWGATAFMSMVFQGLFGMRFQPDGIGFEPLVPEGLGELSLSGIRYRDMDLSIRVQGRGKTVKSFAINQKEQEQPWLPGVLKGRIRLSLEVE